MMPNRERPGDRGWTRVLRGGAVRKDHPCVAALGDLDALNASLGAALAFAKDPGVMRCLESIQGDLFVVGTRLASAPSRGGNSLDAFLNARVTEIDAVIDRYRSVLPRLDAFILPGGSPGGALLHVARATCRIAERSAVTLARASGTAAGVIPYLNRLSGLLFVLARADNRKAGVRDRTVRVRASGRRPKPSRSKRS
jgi:cob(I)alamin adenosyltransferase